MKLKLLLSIIILLLFGNVFSQTDSTNILVANNYFKKGENYLQNRNIDSAVFFFEKSVEVFRESNNLIYLDSTTFDIGVSFGRLGIFELSQKYLLQSLQCSKKLYGDTSLTVRKQYINIASNYNSMYRPDLSLVYLDSTKSNFNAEKNLYYLYSAKARTFDMYQNYDSAVFYYQKSLPIAKKLYSNNPYMIGFHYHNMAITYTKKGEYNKFIEYNKKALSYRQDSVRMLQSYYMIASGYIDIEEYDKSKQICEKAILFSDSVSSPYKSFFLSNIYAKLAIIYREEAKYNLSLDYTEKAISISRENDKLSFLGDKAITLKCQKKYTEALNIFEEVFEIENVKYANLKIKHRESYFNIAELYQEQQKYDSAIYYIDKAFEELIGTKRNLRASDIYELDWLKGLSIKINCSTKNQIANGEFNPETESLLLVADTAINNLYNNAFMFRDKILISNVASNIYLSALEYFSYQQNNTTAFYFSDKNRTILLRKQIEETKIKTFANVPTELLENQNELKIKRTFYETSDIKEHFDSLFAVNQKLDNINEQIKNIAPNYYSLNNFTIPSVSEIQKTIPNNTLLVEYTISDKYYFINIVGCDNLYKTIRIEKPSNFEKVIKEFRSQSYKNILSPENYKIASGRAYELLISPIEIYLTDIESLIIIPDKSLYTINFEALCKPEQEQANNFSELDYLIKNFKITYHYSATLWWQNKTKKQTNHNFEYEILAFAPVFDGETGFITDTVSRSFIEDNSFPQLLKSKKEVRKIHGIFGSGKAKRYVSEQATEQVFKQDYSKGRIIHFATHSKIDSINPNKSYIAFAQIDNPDIKTNEGLFYASEIYLLSDMNAELVVLNSCESGIGVIYNGEGAITLTRGFLYCGVPNVIYSLWDLKDDYAQKLIVRFYRYYNKGYSYSEALQLAKIDMINSKASAPKYWAPHVFLGIN